MNCTVYSAERFLAIPELVSFVANYLTKPGSEFHNKLVDGHFEGRIAVVFDEPEVGGVLGWTRTEEWIDENGGSWDTLESFVDEKRRLSGVASFAATGLRASGALDMGAVAVFEPRMLLVARNAGVFPTLFSRREDHGWAAL
jgi:hypothetical protein